MKELNTYIIEKLNINKETKLNDLSSYVVCIIRNLDLIKVFDSIKEKLLVKNSEEYYYTCIVSVKKHKDTLLEYDDKTGWVDYYRVSKEYLYMDIDDFVDSYKRRLLTTPIISISSDDIKKMKF